MTIKSAKDVKQEVQVTNGWGSLPLRKLYEQQSSRGQAASIKVPLYGGSPINQVQI